MATEWVAVSSAVILVRDTTVPSAVVTMQQSFTPVLPMPGIEVPAVAASEPSCSSAGNRLSVILRVDGPEAVAARRARQRILTREQPPVARFVIDEYVLRHPVGDPSTMDGQLEHLEQVVADGLAHVQVVPVGALPDVVGAFALASVNGRTVAYEESTIRTRVLTEERDLHQLEVVYDRLLGEADAPARSLERIQRVRNDLWRS